MFITGRLAVTESGVVSESEITSDMNVVYIYPKMPYGVKNAVMGAATHVDVKTPRGKRAVPANPSVDFNLGQWNTALLLHNVIGWGGPAFAQFPYSEDARQRLIPIIDDTAPLWQRVIAEINNRNTAGMEASAGPKLKLTTAGAQSSEEPEQSPEDLILS